VRRLGPPPPGGHAASIAVTAAAIATSPVEDSPSSGPAQPLACAPEGLARTGGLSSRAADVHQAAVQAAGGPEHRQLAKAQPGRLQPRGRHPHRLGGTDQVHEVGPTQAWSGQIEGAGQVVVQHLRDEVGQVAHVVERQMVAAVDDRDVGHGGRHTRVALVDRALAHIAADHHGTDEDQMQCLTLGGITVTKRPPSRAMDCMLSAEHSLESAT
jgi:hypothetical protein